jgi:Leucine-rich repeat (LRR) protein
MAWICTAPPTRRAQEKSGRGLCLGFNRYQQIGASSFYKKRRVRLRCDVHDVYGLRLTRWWLQRCSGASPVAVDRNSGLQSPGIRVVGDVVLPAPPQLSDDGECPLSVYCWGNQKVSATSKSQCTNCAILPHLNWSLGDLLSLGRIEYLEIDGAGLSPTPAEWQSCLAFSRGVKEFRINAGAVPLNELLSFLYSNGSTLQSVKISGVTLPRLQVFALAPRIEKMVLRNVTVHPQPVVVVNLSNEGRPPAASQLCKRVPLSDLAALQNLHKLDLMNCKANFDCAGIGRCTLLRSLFLSGCNISDGDVEAIGELRQVEELSLARTRVTNVRPLASAESLRVLLLTNTMVNSAGIEGLQKLPDLIRLDLSSTPITDVNCLSTSSSLTYLNLSKTGVAAEGIQELRRLATLEHLVLNETSVRSVSFLANAQSLKALSLQSTLVDTNGIDGFRRLKTLQDLCLAHTRVTRVTELQHCDHLWRIDLQGTLVDEDGIAGLELLPSLRVLYLSRTDVGDLSLVLESKSLEQLEVKFSRVSRMNPFSGVSRKSPLKEVVLTHCDATDVNDLGLCEGLRVLHLRSTKVTTEGIAGLRDAQNLHEVDLSETGVTDIAPLLGCCQMRTLILYKTMLRSIDGVEALRNLQRLDVAETQVSSIKGLGQCKHLEVLDVSNTPVDDEGFRGIEGAQSLKAVSLSFTPVTQLGALGRCAHLEEVQAQSCPVTSEGLVGLEKAFRLTKLNLSYTRIQGNIERFAICQSLQTLNVKFTDVPLEEVQHVEMCLPRCCVMNDAAVRTKKDVTLT